MPHFHIRATISAFAKKKTAYYLFGVILFIAALFSLTQSKQSVAHSNPSLKRPQHNTKNSLKPYLDSNRLFLRSDVALVVDENDGAVLLDKNIYIQRPIASLTKLMTAMVTLDKNLPRDEVITITKADRDRLRGSKSRLSFGTKLTRRDLLKISLVASENRAALALARTYPGGKDAFVYAMNEKARRLGLKQTAFRDAAGLRSDNVSTAVDLSILVSVAYRYPLIREFSTTAIDYVKDLRSGRKIEFMNTNRLVRGKRWDIDLSKTGYIAEAGHCLVMRANIADHQVVMVLLNSRGYLSKFGDANRIRKWLDEANRKARES